MASAGHGTDTARSVATLQPLHCEICGRQFNRGEHLRRHRRIRRPLFLPPSLFFHCVPVETESGLILAVVTSIVFADQVSDDEDTKEKPYDCHCGRSFARRDLLTRHERLHHRPPPAGSSFPQTAISESQQQPLPLSLFTENYAIEMGGSHESASTTLGSSNLDPTATTLYGSIMEQPDHALHSSNTGAECHEIMQGLSGFLTNVGLDLDLDFNELYSGGPLPRQSSTEVLPPNDAFTATPILTSNNTTNSTPDSTADTAHLHGRIPVMSNGDDDFDELKPFSQPWKVTEQERRQFAKTLEPFSSSLERFMLPSRLSIARYIAGFVDGFTNHHPFIHMPTFRITNYSRTPELVLALLAIGAQYRYEFSRGLSLYRAGRSIILRRGQSRELSRIYSTSLGTRAHNSTTQNIIDFSTSKIAHIDTIGAILLLSIFASWQADSTLIRDSLEYQPLLTSLVRESGLSETESADGDDWLEWIGKETSRRTKLCVFSFLNLQSIAFGLPPVLLSNEIDLRLPTSCKEWLARDEDSWLKTRAEGFELTYFRAMLASLCDDNDTTPIVVTTPFGNFLLIHALLQRLVLSWQFCHTSLSGSNHLHQSHLFKKSLHKWRDAWHKAPESVLDLKNPKGSLAWSATSLFGLAHIRVYFDLGQGCQLYTLRPDLIANAALTAKPPNRGSHLIHALLHSVHALSIPAQLGINFLANCQAYFWSIQHAFCFLECAIFLSKWLLLLSNADPAVALDFSKASETQMVNWALAVVAEVQASLGEVLSESGLPPILTSKGHATDPSRLRYLAIAVVTTFAQLFKQCNSAWPAMLVIGESLQIYADTLRDKLAI